MSYYLGTTNNGLVFFAVSANGSNTVSATASAPLAANDWSFVVASYDGTALRIYVNGQLAAQRPYSGGVYRTSDYLGIGGAAATAYFASYLPFNGLLDELCIYNRALSDSEILALYNSDVTGICQEPPVITGQPQSQTIPLGEDVLFSATIVGSRPLQYQWYFNTQPLPHATNATLLLERVQTNQAGFYSLRVTNSMGFTLSGSAQLSISPKPVCVEPPSGLLSWWPADGSAIDVAGSNNATAQALAYVPGKVGLAFAITNQLIRPPFGLGVTVPSSPSLNFKSNADFTIETWVKTGAPAPLINPLGSRTLPPGTVEVVSKHGLQIFPAGFASDTGYSVLLDSGRLGCWISSGVGRLTNSGTFVSNGPDLRDGMFHHIALSFARNATNGGNLYLDGNNVLTFTTVPFRGDISNTGPLSIGYDGAFSGLIDEFAFYNRALGPDEIMAIRQAGAAGKCKERPFIITQPTNQGVLPGGNATFTVVAGGAPNLRYQWRFNNGVLAGATLSSLTITNVQASKVGNYFVTITNGFGSVTSTNARLALNRPPVANCSMAVVAAGPNCLADASINHGSSDPDGDPIALTQTPAGPYPLGTNVVTLTVTDIWGATNSCTSLVIVLDETPPVIICPGDITVTNAHNAWTRVVTFSPAVSDNCSGAGPALCNPPSGSAFPIGTTVVNCVAVDSSGNSNTCSFKVTVLPGNVPPVPVIKIAPWAVFPWLTNGFVIAGNGTNANVTFDGSKSYDVDDSKFNFAWYLGNTLFSSNMVARQVLQVGSHTVTLRVDDTFPLGTNSTSMTVKVISALDALDLIRQKVLASGLARDVQRVLLDSLDKAQGELQRGHLPPAAQAVRQFQDEVRKRVGALDKVLAGALIQAAQALQNALLAVRPHGRYDGTAPNVVPLAHGRMQVNFAGDPSEVYVIEASSDLVHWEEIGAATQAGDGTFQFEDPSAGQFPNRYYRVATP